MVTDFAEQELPRKFELFVRLFAAFAMTTVKWWYEYSSNSTVKEIRDIIMDNIRIGMYRAFCSRIEIELQMGK